MYAQARNKFLMRRICLKTLFQKLSGIRYLLSGWSYISLYIINYVSESILDLTTLPTLFFTVLTKSIRQEFFISACCFSEIRKSALFMEMPAMIVILQLQEDQTTWQQHDLFHMLPDQLKALCPCCSTH